MIHLRQDLRQNWFMMKPYSNVTISLTLGVFNQFKMVKHNDTQCWFLKKTLSQIF